MSLALDPVLQTIPISCFFSQRHPQGGERGGLWVSDGLWGEIWLCPLRPTWPNSRPETLGHWEWGVLYAPKGTWVGQGWGQPERVSGDHTAHRVCCVAASALWENEHHEVFLFWTIWCPRDPKPKKTRTDEAEPAMLKHAGETGPSGIAQGSSRRFSTRMRVLMTRTNSLLEAPSGSVKPGAKGITPQTDGSHWKLRDLMHIPWAPVAQPGEHALR